MSATNTTTPADKTRTEYLKSKKNLKLNIKFDSTNMDPTDTCKIVW